MCDNDETNLKLMKEQTQNMTKYSKSSQNRKKKHFIDDKNIQTTQWQ